MVGKQKSMRIGGVEVAIAVDERWAGPVRRSTPYRRVIRPVIGRLTGRRNGNGHHADAPPAIEPRKPQLDASRYPAEAREIVGQVNEIDWYHTIELPHGVVTPGRSDHRRQLPYYGLPADMRGLRALDVATFDGYWAFEMERRGADVVAVDLPTWDELDIPLAQREEYARRLGGTRTGEGFRLAHRLLGSAVERTELNVYDLSPDRVGLFDVTFLSDLLQHIRDPQRALERVFGVTRPGGYIILGEVFNPDLDAFKDLALTQFIGFEDLVWSIPSTAALKRMLAVAGFTDIVELARFQLQYDHPNPPQKITLKASRA